MLHFVPPEFAPVRHVPAVGCGHIQFDRSVAETSHAFNAGCTAILLSALQKDTAFALQSDGAVRQIERRHAFADALDDGDEQLCLESQARWARERRAGLTQESRE